MDALVNAINGLGQPEQRTIMMRLLAAQCYTCPEFGQTAPDKQLHIVKYIERGAFNRTINDCITDNIMRKWTDEKFVARYSSICSKVAYNLGQPDSGLVAAILGGQLEPSSVAGLSSRLLNPSASEKEYNTLVLRLNQKIEHKFAKIKCRHCKGNRVVFKETAKAAADEPTSITYHCWDCDSKWSKGGG